jgi:transposase
VLSGLRGERSIAELCRHERIAESLYYVWSKEFLEAGKKRLAGGASDFEHVATCEDLDRPAG